MEKIVIELRADIEGYKKIKEERRIEIDIQRKNVEECRKERDECRKLSKEQDTRRSTEITTKIEIIKKMDITITQIKIELETCKKQKEKERLCCANCTKNDLLKITGELNDCLWREKQCENKIKAKDEKLLLMITEKTEIQKIYEKYRQDIIIIKQNCEKRDGEDRILITDLRSKIKELEVQLKTCEIERIRTKEYEER